MLTDKRSQYARATMRFAGYLLAIGLLVASIWYALQGQRIEDWWVLLAADPWLTLGFFVTVIVSAVIVPGIGFWLVTRPFVSGNPLSLTSMQAIVAASGLLNYTPFKAGLIGRVAYLKQIHGVSLRAAILTHAVIAVVFVSSSLLTALITVWRGNIDIVWWVTSVTGLGVLTVVIAPILRAAISSDSEAGSNLHSSVGAVIWYLLPCFAVQLLGLYCTALRWWLVFQVLDRPIALADAWMAAIIHMIAVMAGPANGLGLREWLIGIGGQFGGLHAGLELDLRVSMSAALIDRAAEAAVLSVLGLLGLAFLRYRHQRLTKGSVRAEQNPDG